MKKSKSSNSNLHNAKKAKNDEFYTQLTDIEKELKHYKSHFEGKTVFLNCDDPESSNFWEYFKLNFEHLKLKKLISTHYDATQPTYKLEMTKDGVVKTPLVGNGDFRNAECIELLKESDIVVTNPPFSLFREYVAQLMEYEKKFLIVGNVANVNYKNIFPLFKNNKVWFGFQYGVMSFMKPDKTTQKFGNIGWFTNLDVSKRHQDLILYRKYDPVKYPKYDNYDAINVDKVSDIPEDYYGVMGVPVTFFDKYNPDQFEIIGISEDCGKGQSMGLWNGYNAHCTVNKENKYMRIFIKRKVN